MPDKDLFGPAPKKEELIAGELMLKGELTVEEIAQKAGLAVEQVQAALKNPQIKGYLAKHLDDAGATLEASARVIAEAHGAVARQVVSYMGDATVVDIGPDHQIRLKASELNLKARGELREGVANVNLFAGLTDEQLAKIATGELDPATLIDVGPRIENPAEAK